jgi:hypothetical protein
VRSRRSFLDGRGGIKLTNAELGTELCQRWVDWVAFWPRSQISLDQRYRQDRGEVERNNYQEHRQ